MLGQRGVAVPVRHGFDAEPLSLELVIAVRELRIGGLHRFGESIYHLVLDHVGKVHRRLWSRILAPAVVDLLVLGERVGDQRENRDILALHLAEGFGCFLADLRILARELVEDLRLAQHLVAKGIAQARDGLVEQARPGGAADDVFLVQRLLQLVRQLMRAINPKIAQPGRIFGEFRRLELGLDVGILDLVDLQPEKDELRTDIGQFLGDVLGKAAALGIGHVLGIVERGIGADPAHAVAERLETRDRPAQRLAVERCNLAFIVPGKRLGFGGRPRQVGVEIGAGRAGIEVGEVPGRQIAQHSVHTKTPYCLPISGSAAMASRKGPIKRAA